MRLELDDLTVTIGDVLQTSSTTIAGAGAYVVVVATTLPDQVVQLTSCYLAGLRGPAAASHMLDVRGPHYRFHQQLLPDLLAGTTHPRRCLLHHAGELQAALVDLKDAQVLVDVGPRGLERADRVWDADVNTS